ncbi:MAG: hypothetical protein IT559_07925 [Alphaproteobacteria bacterium]|nr:hypothetical protein [Alphaproteobacteria bacterium]
MRYFIFSVFAVILYAFPLLPAMAEGGGASCSSVDPASLGDDPGHVYCDIYQRQLSYGEEDEKFKQMLKARQKNYQAPRQEALNAYARDVQALHKKREEQSRQVSGQDIAPQE